jgi:hypothetical protein
MLFNLKKTPIILLIVLLCSSLYLNLQTVHAEQEPTLAEVIDSVASNIQTNDSLWNVIYGQVFGLQNQTVFDNSILQALSQNDCTDVIFIARLAELNNYSSPTIDSSVKTALENIPMAGSLPITYTGSDAPDSFLLYDRYMVNAYQYAQELNVPGWNLTQAYLDFVKAYMTPPENSYYGEMLWINPQENFSESYSGRYYDEHAETLDMFLEFALAGINGSMNYADDAWLNTQSHWNGKYYFYSDTDQEVECEMGNFAQIIAEYQNYRGAIPYFDRVISDLEYKLLSSEYNSPAWGTIGVLKHAESNPQLRLGETMGALIALQMLYPYFTNDSQANFRDMLTIGWQGLVNSSLYSNNQFRMMDTYGDDAYGDDASLLGLMTLFLYGIIPDTGYLAINASNERYQDYQTCFPTSEWKFDYQNSSIRIPVMQGNLTFIFGSENVSQDFPSNGVYDIQFANDWNNITSITQIADINTTTLQPVTLQTIPRPTPSPTPVATPQPSPIPTATPTPTLTPTPPQTSPSSTPTQKHHNGNPTQTADVVFIVSVGGVMSVTALFYVNVKGKKPRLPRTK